MSETASKGPGERLLNIRLCACGCSSGGSPTTNWSKTPEIPFNESNTGRCLTRTGADRTTDFPTRQMANWQRLVFRSNVICFRVKGSRTNFKVPSHSFIQSLPSIELPASVRAPTRPRGSHANERTNELVSRKNQPRRQRMAPQANSKSLLP